MLCYFIQHPSQYSPRGLEEAKALLKAFVEEGATPDEIRRKNRERVDSGRRTWKVTGEAASHGRPLPWTMTVADVAVGGLEGYCERVEAWARSVNTALK